MANKIGAIRYIECSALTKDGVRKVFEVRFHFLIPMDNQYFQEATRAALKRKKDKKSSNKCTTL